MITIKTPKEIAIMRKGGKILAETLKEVLFHAVAGMSELELDAMAEEFIRENGAEPGFQKVEGYKHTICVSTNDVVVHGIPTNYKLKNGDVLGIDCGVFLDGFHTDMSETIIIGGKSKTTPDVVTFVEAGKKALELAIA
ncbi:MAG: M24 family metallopeptidase, partial [Candidatus Levyibacteriota bacterium]